MLENDNEDLVENEVLIGDSDDLLIEGDISDPVLTNEEENLFVDPDTGDSDFVMDESLSFVYPEGIDLPADETIVPQDNIAADLQLFSDSLTYGSGEDAEGDPDPEAETSAEVIESLQIIQQNVKTGFDNLSLIGTVNVGLMSFSIGALIIYCYIGRFR